MSIRQLETPLNDEIVSSLSCGDEVRLSGTIYTARDQAHRRICALMDKGEKLPIELTGTVIYFAGPTPAKPGKPIGSVGPTTAYRMDAFSPRLIEAGLKGMIAKGGRAPEVINAMKKHGAVYFAATGGAGALIAQCVKAATCVAYEELGPEAIYKLEVKDFPLLVAIDCKGNNIYVSGPEKYKS